MFQMRKPAGAIDLILQGVKFFEDDGAGGERLLQALR